ncbi:hypothetical protein vBPaerPsIn_130 [Pseudomonas phage vB_Paer_PsIn]|uniref:Uncharacterized protein n=1 Tax=Pseudomonas phage vB_Paer_PsIn TaxID=2924907 RepID=A0AAE9GQ84_9CAUD|nr:hypothetical protein QE348_gp130 [Pseudomonas phage vB_Paer_PsIn]UOL48158.1 hypothetical protein vBPaerPsIn_130 [Pseudomonas phage vB_Paer_PsIn]
MNNKYKDSIIAEYCHFDGRRPVLSLAARWVHHDSRVVKLAALFACAGYGRPYKDCIRAYKDAKQREKDMRNPAKWKLSRATKRALRARLASKKKPHKGG